MARRTIAFGNGKAQVEVSIEEGEALFGIQGANEQDFLSIEAMSPTELAQELRDVADFLDPIEDQGGIRLPAGFLLDTRIRGLTDPTFRLLIALRLLARPEADGLMVATYASMHDLASVAGLDEPSETNTTSLVTDGIRELESVDLVRHDDGGRRLVIMR